MTTSPVAVEPVVPEVSRPKPPGRIRLITILGALSAFAPLSIDMYLPALPILSQDFNASPSQVQLTLSACLLGLAAGQVFAGPVSDVMGRRRPLLIGIAAYTLASLLCVIAPSVGILIALRFVQGAAGAAGIVIARAIVRDLHSGVAVARFFSLLMIVSGLAPILAPIIGAQVLHFTSWHGVFVILAAIGLALLVAVGFGLSETLPPESRQAGSLRITVATFRKLLGNRAFLGFALGCGLAFSAMFAYISGSPYVLQGIYGASPQLFSLIFGLNAFGLMIAGQINGRLVGRIPPLKLLTGGLIVQAFGAVALFLIIAGGIGLSGILPALFVVVASLGFVMPNATALALSGHPRTAGSASALLGVMQYITGATAAPLVGIAGEMTALPMGIVIAVASLSALTIFLLLGRNPSAIEEQAA